MTWRVVVADRIADAGLAQLRAAPEVELQSAVGDATALRALLPGAHALLVRSDTQVTGELIGLAPALRVIGRAGIGVDNIDLATATRRGIAVLNAPGANTVSAAEHTLGLLLALVRRVPWAAQSMRAGAWDRKTFAGVELRGKTLGIVGLGRIGAHVATVARALGMKVCAHDPFLAEQRARELGVELLPLDDLLAQADAVTLHLPLTAETRHLLDTVRLGRMKRGALLVNTARGELVDETALLAAVTDGHLGGAALDVFALEPLPADSPLRGSDRLLLTPHLAASTKEAQDRAALEICQAVLAALAQGDVGGAVNVAGVSGEVMRRIRPLLDLSRRLGRAAALLAPAPVEAVEVEYGGADDEAPRPLKLAAVEGMLGAMGLGSVSIINAQALAAERGIRLSRRKSAPLPGFETTVTVGLRHGETTTTVVGAIVGDRPRIVQINGYSVDVPSEGHLVIVTNRDVPGVIGRVGTVLGEAGANIGVYHQSRRAGAAEALAAIAVDQPLPADVVRRLRQLADVLDVRVAELNGER
jgi:D-3-phosphoglycerate dehydrogenase / 2-oxoglutarate reductase